jgi:hypothetical protein
LFAQQLRKCIPVDELSRHGLIKIWL